YLATLYQLLVALILLWLTRFAFYFYNADVTGSLSAGRLAAVALAGLQFDIVAVAYANALFVVMRFLPFGFVMKRWWRRAS
ncbi:LTA synthase family protein, partial [Xanthomonas citri pv. citri]|nr:LTA synthase family protein [Xanthomonas citri pv. citri]